MNVRMIQLDGKLPNLALMKLSAWHKSQGDDVYFTNHIYRQLGEPVYDKVYGSAIFKFSNKHIAEMQREWPDSLIGGTGTTNLGLVEFITGDFKGLDYTIYPKFSSSIGFTQRGCRLKCSFCVVPTKEGKVREEATIADIWRGHPWPKQLHLLDNDFFGQPHWRERCEEIIDGKFEVCLNQGINVRLIHKEGAQLLAKMKYRDDGFKTPRIYTAWDNRNDEEVFVKGITTLIEAGINPKHIMVYMLCGYWLDETFDDVMYRFKKMTEMKLRPYPMVYDISNKLLRKFQRWVVRRYYEFIPWEDFQYGR